VTAKILNAAKNCAWSARGVGVDNVDVETATTPWRGGVERAGREYHLNGGARFFIAAQSCPEHRARRCDVERAAPGTGKIWKGVELYNKTLGIIGMGRIGSELSRRAIAFGMRVLAFDPYLSASRARSLQVELVEEIDELLAAADFISLHTPLTAETRHILNAERLAKTKRGVRIINCARGGLIDEQALADAISSGHVAGAALDVFETEPLPPDSPLRKIPNLVLTPHLGASTAEAQESVGIEIAQSIRAALLEGTIRNAVNMPTLDAKTLALIGPHLRFGRNLAASSLSLRLDESISLNINYSGKVNEVDTTAITRAVLKGFCRAPVETK
jgi:D-3-phosphoglycerate dehydrogenase